MSTRTRLRPSISVTSMSIRLPCRCSEASGRTWTDWGDLTTRLFRSRTAAVRSITPGRVVERDIERDLVTARDRLMSHGIPDQIRRSLRVYDREGRLESLQARKDVAVAPWRTQCGPGLPDALQRGTALTGGVGVG